MAHHDDYDQDWWRNRRFWGSEYTDYSNAGYQNYPFTTAYMNHPYFWNAEESPYNWNTSRYYEPEYWQTPRPTYEEWWATPGPYTGRGPRGYVRSEKDIEQEVCERLMANGQLDASNIEVAVDSHKVTLKGTVGSRQDKRLVEEIAETVFGVDDVNNQLHINHQNQLPSATTRQSMEQRPASLYRGQQVVGEMGKPIGTVREIHSHDFVLDRAAAPDLHVPFTAVQDANGIQLSLNVSADKIDQQGWTHI